MIRLALISVAMCSLANTTFAGETTDALVKLEKRLHGTWVGRGLVAPTITFHADGKFTQGSTGVTEGARGEGTWKLDWDVLPPTLILAYTSADPTRLTGGTHEKKILALDSKTLALEDSDRLSERPTVYSRPKTE